MLEIQLKMLHHSHHKIKTFFSPVFFFGGVYLCEMMGDN